MLLISVVEIQTQNTDTKACFDTLCLNRAVISLTPQSYVMFIKSV